MFGKTRAAPLLERPHSKIIKDDSLSIYETTLIKLRQGSRSDSSLLLHPREAVRIDTDCTCEIISTHCGESAAMDIDCAACPSSNSGGDSQPVDGSNQQQKRTVSLQAMFLKYKSSRDAKTGAEDSACIPPGSGHCQFMRNADQQLGAKSVSSLPLLQPLNLEFSTHV